MQTKKDNQPLIANDRDEEDRGKKPMDRSAGKSPRRRRFPWHTGGWGWNPLLGLESIKFTMNEMLSDLFSREMGHVPELPWQPAIDLYEEEDNLIVEAPLPGVQKKNISIHATPTLLILDGTILRDKVTEAEKFHIRERRWGHFSRSIALPHEVKPDKIRAEMKDGVLVILLPVRQSGRQEARKIDIE